MMPFVESIVEERLRFADAFVAEGALERFRQLLHRLSCC